MNDAEHGGDDTESGQGIGHALHRMAADMKFGVVGLKLGVDQRFDLVRVFGAERHHAQIVAQELDRVMVVLELRELGEERALVRLFHMLLKGQHALGLRQTENLIKHRQQFQIIGLLVVGTFQRAFERCCRGFQTGLRAADDERADGRAKNNNVFRRLP